VNEILVNPVKNPELAGIRWLPMGTLQASGQMQMNQLRLPAGPGESYRLSDTALYDPPTGRFMRIVQKDDQVIFATSYDGKSVFTFQPGGTGEARVVKIPVAEAFQAPKDPAGFLGIGAGFQSRIDEQDSTRVQRLEDTTLADGTPVRVLKTNPMTPEGTPESYMLFRIRQDNGTIAEMEWMAAGESLLLFRRIKTSTLEDRGIHWDLSEIDTKAKPGVSSPEVVPDMVIPDVSVEHMAEKADFAVYIFSATPAWTQRRVILDILDIASPPHRMFALAYPASDKRHVVMIQAVTYNQAFGHAREVFEAALPLCEECGVTICMEQLTHQETNFCQTVDETLELIEAINHPNFQLLLDTKAMAFQTEDRPALIRRCAKYLKHYHANDANLNGPGWGEVDFAPIFDALRDIGYDRYVSVEVFKFEPGPEAIARKSLEYMRRFV